MVGHNRASRPPPRGVVASLLRPRDELRAGQPEVFGPVASVPTAFRVVDAIDDELLAGNRAARARVRRVVWAAGLNPVTEHGYVTLKAFQRLGYFPKLEDVPPGIVEHIRGCLGIGPDVALGRRGRAPGAYITALIMG